MLEAARKAGVGLSAACGGRGVCGECGVRVLSGHLVPPDDAEVAGLVRAPEGVRLACRARVTAPAVLRPVMVAARSVSRSEYGGEGADLVAGVDLGTTSVAAVLIEEGSGRERGRASVANRQQSYGADVVSRIAAALDGGAQELRGLAEESVCDALLSAARAAAVPLSNVRRVVIAGNTVMASLLIGADVTSLAAYPFTPPDLDSELPIDSAVRSLLAEGVRVTLLPPMAGFIGGDALAAVVSGGLTDLSHSRLLVDLGTNAEILLSGNGTLSGASTAAGSAFEGVGLFCGGPAVDGAVERVVIDEAGSVELTVIGGGDARWLSGAGLISAVAELVRIGAVNHQGAFVEGGPLGRRMTILGQGVAGVCLGERETGIVISQLDIRALQLAKAAVRVGVEAVVSASGIPAARIDEVLVAGAFGKALWPEDLLNLGVLPTNFRGRVRQVGNAALDGAAAIALDPDVLDNARATARELRHIDLATTSGFGVALIAATALEPFSV